MIFHAEQQDMKYCKNYILNIFLGLCICTSIFIMPVSGNTNTVGSELRITDVWRSNLHEEFKKIRLLIKDYNYVAMVSFLVFSYLAITNCITQIVFKIVVYIQLCIMCLF